MKESPGQLLTLLSNFTFSFIVGKDVCGCGDDIHGLLGALPHLLHLLIPRAQHHQDPIHLPHIPGLLLAGNVKHLRQPNHLLLDEQVR